MIIEIMQFYQLLKSLNGEFAIILIDLLKIKFILVVILLVNVHYAIN